MQQKNHQVVLSRPLNGVPVAEDFRVQEAEIPEPGPGELLVRHIYLSLDPYQRSAIAGRHMASQQPLGAGAMPMAETVGQVLRFWPEYVLAQKAIEDGRIGDLLLMSGRRMVSLLAGTSGADGWRRDPERSGGAVLDTSTLEAVRAVEAPRLERAVLGARAGDGPPDEWAAFLGTCLFVAMPTEADAAAVRSWGYQGSIAVVGHPADHPNAAAALLAALREEAS